MTRLKSLILTVFLKKKRKNNDDEKCPIDTEICQGFFEYALENNVIDRCYDDLKLVSDTLKENDELRLILEKSFVSVDYKTDILVKIFKPYILDVSMQLLTMMVKKAGLRA